jgi:hypothetical protein
MGFFNEMVFVILKYFFHGIRPKKCYVFLSESPCVLYKNADTPKHASNGRDFSREPAAGEPTAAVPEAAAAAGRTKRRPERADTEEDEDSTSSATVSRSATIIVKDSVTKAWYIS